MPSSLRGPLYLDASALVKLYLPEPESQELDRAVARRRDLIISDLAITEIVSAAARRSRQGTLDHGAAVELQRQILEDAESGYFTRVGLAPKTHREAERFLLSLSGGTLRAADALHLALALIEGTRTLLTFDRRLAEAARSAGMATAP
jgi:predicted nucleic acid-binding protein